MANLGESPSPKIVVHQVKVRLEERRRFLEKLRHARKDHSATVQLLKVESEVRFLQDVMDCLSAFIFAHEPLKVPARLVLERRALFDVEEWDGGEKLQHLRRQLLQWMDGMALEHFKHGKDT